MAARTTTVKSKPAMKTEVKRKSVAAPQSEAETMQGDDAFDDEEEDGELIGEDEPAAPAPQPARRSQAPARQAAPQPRQRDNDDEEQSEYHMEGDLAFASGLFRGTGKMIFQVTCDVERIMQAIKAAARESAIPGKVKIKILENIKGKAHAWLAFSPLSDEPPPRQQGRGGYNRGNQGGYQRSNGYQSRGGSRSGGQGNSQGGGSYGGRGRYQGDSWGGQRNQGRDDY